MLVDEIHNGLHRRTRKEDATHAHRLQLGNIDVGNDAANDHEHVIEPLRFRSSITFGQMCMCAPLRIDNPMTSASSCSVAATIISAVCRSPV